MEKIRISTSTTLPMECRTPDNLRWQRRPLRPLPILSGRTLGQPTNRGSVSPVVCWCVEGPHGGDMLETCSTAPHTGSHSTNCCQSPAETPSTEMEIGHLLDSLSSRRHLCHKISSCLLPLFPRFFLLRLPHALPFSFAQILMTFVSCTLCVRNLVGNLSLAS